MSKRWETGRNSERSVVRFLATRFHTLSWSASSLESHQNAAWQSIQEKGFPYTTTTVPTKLHECSTQRTPEQQRPVLCQYSSPTLVRVLCWRRGFMSSAHVNFQLHSEVGVSVQHSLPLSGCYDYHTTGKTPPFSPSNTHKHGASASVCRFCWCSKKCGNENLWDSSCV